MASAMVAPGSRTTPRRNLNIRAAEFTALLLLLYIVNKQPLKTGMFENLSGEYRGEVMDGMTHDQGTTIYFPKLGLVNTNMLESLRKQIARVKLWAI